MVRNIPLWLEQFPGDGTKVTISSPDLPYIKESVLHLYNLGIHEVNINCVFEDVWQEGDDSLFEEQLIHWPIRLLIMDFMRKTIALFFPSIWVSLWTVNCKIRTGVVPE